MLCHLRIAIGALLTAVAMAIPSQASAFDTYAHTQLTNSAMTAEGFGGEAVALGDVMNWFPDLYHDASAVHQPASGQSRFLERVLTPDVRSENWPESVIEAATRSHFYDARLTVDGGVPTTPEGAQMPSLGTTAGVTAEWERLERAVGMIARQARDENSPEKLDAIIGMSLHPVQDFYSHTNWTEPRAFHRIPGADGPGWSERGWGSNPTWFDIPASVRNEYRIYGAETPGHREHGDWNADGNNSLVTGMAKDWPGRPLHAQAMMTAYFASRQWVEAIRSWVNDDRFWRAAEDYEPTTSIEQCELEHDMIGMHQIMFYSGQWMGEGEPTGGHASGPGGDLVSLRSAVSDYFGHFCPTYPPQDHRGSNPHTRDHRTPKPRPVLVGPKTRWRAQFEHLILEMANPNATGPVGPVPSSIDLQRQTRFVALRINQLHAEELGDPGPDAADMYANVRIDEQPSSSSEINSEDNFAFPLPYAPFTWIQAVPATPSEEEPVESIEVEVKTGNDRWAGTDDTVYLRLGPGMKVPLDKRFSDDFERGDHDNYVAPIDDLVAPGIRDTSTENIALAPINSAAQHSLRVGDIEQITIEKSGDGIAGSWELGGIKVRVNNEVVYNNQNINRWIGDGHLRWTAPDFKYRNPRGSKIPVSIFLADEDSFIYGSDDEGDINPDDHRRVLSIGYGIGERFTRIAKGGGRLGGRVGFEHGDKASIMYSMETITPEPPPVEPPPVDPETSPREEADGAAKPDLIITQVNGNEVTVKNQGEGAAGPFRLRAFNEFEERTLGFGGLAAGATDTRDFEGLGCDAGFEWTAIVDDLGQVRESNEFNNEREFEGMLC